MTSSNGGGSAFSIIEEKTVPDAYADSTRFEVSVYGITLEFGQTRPTPGVPGRQPHIPRVRVHMSPQHAKVVARLLAKNLRQYEAQVGTINVPLAILRELGIEEEGDV